MQAFETALIMETLKTILKEFDVNRSTALKKMGEEHFPDDISSDSIIASCFHPIADIILYNGHFRLPSDCLCFCHAW